MQRHPHEQVFILTAFPWQLLFARVDGKKVHIFTWRVCLLKSCYASSFFQGDLSRKKLAYLSLSKTRQDSILYSTVLTLYGVFAWVTWCASEATWNNYKKLNESGSHTIYTIATRANSIKLVKVKTCSCGYDAWLSSGSGNGIVSCSARILDRRIPIFYATKLTKRRNTKPVDRQFGPILEPESGSHSKRCSIIQAWR